MQLKSHRDLPPDQQQELQTELAWSMNASSARIRNTEAQHAEHLAKLEKQAWYELTMSPRDDTQQKQDQQSQLQQAYYSAPASRSCPPAQWSLRRQRRNAALEPAARIPRDV